MGCKIATTWRIYVRICFLLMPAVTLVTNGNIFPDVDGKGRDTRSVSENNELMHKPEGGCVLMIDDRTFKPKDLSPDQMFEARGKKLPFFIASRIINRAYARRHGYQFIVGNPETLGKNVSGRHSAWRKIPFVQQQLECCCQWALYVDSDVYIRMDEHKLSIEQWLQLLDTPGYLSWIEKKYNFSLEEAGQVHLPKKASSILLPSDQTDGLIFIGPRNGDPTHGYGGSAGLFPDFKICLRDCDFINSGVLLFRNSPLTHKLLDEWWNEPNEKLFKGHPWEQPRLSEIAPDYKTHMGVIPHLEATGPEGRQIRHLWAVHGPSLQELRLRETTERREQMHLAILSLAALQEEDYLAQPRKENTD